MRTEDLSMFCQIFELRSFSKAADTLFASRNKCMRTIDALESELGCALFERSSKGLSPTANGEKLYSFAKKIEKEYSEMYEDLHGDDSIKTIRLGYSGFSADKYIASTCAKNFAKNHSGLRICDVQVERDNALRNLRDGKIDVLFAMLPLDESDLKTKHLITFEFVLLMNKTSKYYPENKILAKEKISDLPLIFTMFSDTPIRVLRSHLHKDFSDNIVYRTNDLGLIFRLVDENVGVAVLIKSDGKMGEKYSSDLSMVSINPSIKCKYGLIYTAEFETNNKQFLDFMSDNFPKALEKKRSF